VRYDAFISYSHAADDALAPALQRALQGLARPWNRRRALEVFRDDTGLAVSPGLWSSICAGLDESAYFVLLASPGAAESVWVNREIERWTASHPVDNLLPVVTDGEWVWGTDGDFDWERSTAVPQALRGLFSEEPRHLDLHWARTENELDLRNSRFRQAVAQLAAPMHSTTPQDLDSADVANYRRVVRLRRTVVLAMAVLLVLVSVAGVLAVRNARESKHQQDVAETNAARAQEQARRATALGLVAQSEIEGSRERSLSILLSVEASVLDPAESWGSLINGLQDAPGLTRLFDLPDSVGSTDAAAVSPDGAVIAAPTSTGNIQLWDLSTMQRAGGALVDQDLYPRSPTQLVFGRTGLLAGQFSCTRATLCDKEQRTHSVIEVWDPTTRRHQRLPLSVGFVSLALSADGRRIAAHSPDGLVRVWDLRSGAVVAAGRAGRGAVSGVALSLDGSTIAVASAASQRLSILQIDGQRLTARRTIVAPGLAPGPLAFGGDHRFASVAENGRVAMWNVSTGTSVGTLPSSGSAPVTDIASTADGLLATIDASGILRLWDAATLRARGTPHSAGPSAGGSVAFTSDGRLVSVDRDVRVWNVQRWDQSGALLYRQRGGVAALAISPSGLLASAGQDGEILLSRVGGDEPSREIRAGQGPITALAMRSDGILASGGADGTVRLWNTDTGEPVQTLPSNNQGAIASLAFSPDGGSIAVGYHRGPHDPPTDDLPVWVWNFATGEAVSLEAGLAQRVSALAFGTGGVFATAGEDYLKVYDSYQGDYKVLAQHPGAFFNAVAFSPDGKTLASSGYRKGQSRGDTVGLWDLTVQEPPQTRLPADGTPGWNGLFASLAYSPHGDILAGAGEGGLQLWDARTRVPLGGLLRPSAATSVVFTPDGQSVIVGDERGLVQTYPATVDGWQDAACAVVARNLTESEWATFVGDAEPYQKTCPQY
jgi:WD40 repeat protein